MFVCVRGCGAVPPDCRHCFFIWCSSHVSISKRRVCQGSTLTRSRPPCDHRFFGLGVPEKLPGIPLWSLNFQTISEAKVCRNPQIQIPGSLSGSPVLKIVSTPAILFQIKLKMGEIGKKIVALKINNYNFCIFAFFLNQLHLTSVCEGLKNGRASWTPSIKFTFEKLKKSQSMNKKCRIHVSWALPYFKGKILLKLLSLHYSMLGPTSCRGWH